MKCNWCKERHGIEIELKKRATVPWSANRANAKYFDYYICPSCKVNVAKQKTKFPEYLSN